MSVAVAAPLLQERPDDVVGAPGGNGRAGLVGGVAGLVGGVVFGFALTLLLPTTLNAAAIGVGVALGVAWGTLISLSLHRRRRIRAGWVTPG